MKRSILAIAAIALSASAAQAQTTTGVARPFSFGVSAGATIPTGDFGSSDNNFAAKSGYNINGLIGFQPAVSPIGFRGELMYNRGGVKDASDAHSTVLGGNVNAIYNFPTGSTSGIAPYLIGGIGYSQVKFTDEDGGVEVSVKKSGFGLNGGVGVKMPLSGFTTFVEARYHYVMSEDKDNFIPNASFIPVSFGIMF